MKRLLAAAALVALAGCGVEESAPPALGTVFPAPAGTLTFNRDIAPLVHRHCTPCHRPGETAPFPLIEYGDVVKRGEQIVEVVWTGYMPPWLPERGGHVFHGERGLSDEEIGRLAQWVAEGAERGDPADAPPAPRFTPGWQGGEPDLVLELPAPYTLAADGFDVFRNLVYRVPIEKRRWVRALEFRPGDTRAVHHATLAVDRSPASRLQDERDPLPGFDGMINTHAQRPDGHLLGWVPGKMPYAVDPAIAWRLDPGDDLVAQLHLQPTGRPEAVQPRIGLWFSDRPPTRTPFLLRLGSLTLDIPAGDPGYTVEDHYVLPVGVRLLGLVPHAHYVGRRMTFWATRPDGTRLDLLEIPDWDFNWQDEYRYVDPVVLPKGTALSMRYVYDNSADNPRNPSVPPVRVRFGPDTTDEMGDLWIQVLPDREDELQILAADFTLKDLRAQVDGYRAYLEVEPDDATSRVELGRALEALGRLDEALEQYRRAVDSDPGHTMALHRLAMALRAAGDNEAALGYLRAVISTSPELARLHFNLGQTLLALDRAGEAADAFREAIELQDDLAEAHHALGGIAAAAGRRDEAERRYRDALARDPEYAQAYNNLGSLLASGGRLAEAERAFVAAVEADPGYAAAHDNLGKVLASTGRLERALQHFTAAVRLQPDSAAMRRNLDRARRMAASGG